MKQFMVLCLKTQTNKLNSVGFCTALQCTDLWQRREGGFAGEDEAGFLREGPSTEKLGRTQRVCQPPSFPGGTLRADWEPVNQLAGMVGLGAAAWNP